MHFKRFAPAQTRIHKKIEHAHWTCLTSSVYDTQRLSELNQIIIFRLHVLHCHLNAAQNLLFRVVQSDDKFTEMFFATEILQELGEHFLHARLEDGILHKFNHQLVILLFFDVV